MSNIDKEWLQQKIADMEAARDEIPFGLDEDDSNTLAAMKLALASLEAEPVAWRSLYYENHGLLTGSKNVLASWQKQGWECEPLYTAPPVPVSVPDDVMAAMQKVARIRLDLNDFDGDKLAILDCLSDAEEALIEVVNRRAAMLQGAEPVTTACKLPVNTPCKDAPEQIWLQTAGVWPENGEFSELTWCSDNQHPDDTLYVRADVVGGNSPVIPDGLRLALSNAGIAAPESDEMLYATHEKYVQMLVNWVKDRKPFKSAAPQQEVK
ncbi:hypothetical protein [Enterobacter sp. BNK-8]|uniref:hypothetical protein n=1 Tax=Enterobacter sp. BNK-8 TaxID=3376145 RepID=UPI003B507A6C